MSNSDSRFKRMAKKLVLPVSLICLILFFMLVFFYHQMFITVGPGHAGVKWKRFAGGTDTVNIYDEGLHLVWPWDHMEVFDVRLTTDVDNINVLTSDGLHIDITVSVRYRLNRNNVGILYKNVGSKLTEGVKYVDVLLDPEVQAFARLIFAQYGSEDIFSDDRAKIQSSLKEQVIYEVEVVHTEGDESEPFIYIQDVLIESIVLPEMLQQEIEKKLAQKHLMLSYEYRLQREKLESQRKEIEALGIRKFQDIVDDGITDRYLRWKGIDATLALASSNNSKVVIIGAGDEGLPLILGNMGGDSPPTNQAKPVPPTSLDGQNFNELLNAAADSGEYKALFESNGNKTSTNIPGVTPSVDASTDTSDQNTSGTDTSNDDVNASSKQ